MSPLKQFGDGAVLYIFGNCTTVTDPMRYCGEYHDAETGFIYLRARYYSPQLGRFINEDPIRDGLNWYAYCGNNPVSFVDPDGESLSAAAALLIIGAGGLLLSGCSGSGDNLYDRGAGHAENFANNSIPKFPGWDATVSPGSGWEWRGNGSRGSAYGAWYNPATDESLHPDLNHPGNIAPHWDYTSPDGKEYRIFEDGSFEEK